MNWMLIFLNIHIDVNVPIHTKEHFMFIDVMFNV